MDRKINKEVIEKLVEIICAAILDIAPAFLNTLSISSFDDSSFRSWMFSICSNKYKFKSPNVQYMLIPLSSLTIDIL